MNNLLKFIICLNSCILILRNTTDCLATEIDMSKWNYDDLRQTAMEMYADHNYKDALLFFDKAIRVSPDNPEGYLNRGGIYALLNNTEKAIQDEQRAIELAKSPTKENIGIKCFAHQNLAGIYLKNKQLPKAEAEGRLAINLCPKEPLAQQTLAEVLLRNQKKNEAVFRLTKAKELYSRQGLPQESAKINARIIELQSK